MSAFDETRKVEATGREHLSVFLDCGSNGRTVWTDKGRLSRDLQLVYGDAFVNCRNGYLWAVECKVEFAHTGNLFLETWSNKSRINPGWMMHLKADILLYYFLEQGILYSIALPKLQAWAFGVTEETERIAMYPLKPQKKYQQLNDTWGRCVPVSAIREHVGLVKYQHENGWFGDGEKFKPRELPKQAPLAFR